MSKIVYTSEDRYYPLVSPYQIARNLLKKRELILACARRDFHASYRETLLGAVWPVLNPLIMLAMFTLVFGYIFGGRFDQSTHENSCRVCPSNVRGLKSLYVHRKYINIGSKLSLGQRGIR